MLIILSHCLWKRKIPRFFLKYWKRICNKENIYLRFRLQIPLNILIKFDVPIFLKSLTYMKTYSLYMWSYALHKMYRSYFNLSSKIMGINTKMAKHKKKYDWSIWNGKRTTKLFWFVICILQSWIKL